jgi:hypothetical protein
MSRARRARRENRNNSVLAATSGDDTHREGTKHSVDTRPRLNSVCHNDFV